MTAFYLKTGNVGFFQFPLQIISPNHYMTLQPKKHQIYRESIISLRRTQKTLLEACNGVDFCFLVHFTRLWHLQTLGQSNGRNWEGRGSKQFLSVLRWAILLIHLPPRDEKTGIEA